MGSFLTRIAWEFWSMSEMVFFANNPTGSCTVDSPICCDVRHSQSALRIARSSCKEKKAPVARCGRNIHPKPKKHLFSSKNGGSASCGQTAHLRFESEQYCSVVEWRRVLELANF